MKLLFAVLMLSSSLSAQIPFTLVQQPAANAALAAFSQSLSTRNFGAVTACDWSGDGHDDLVISQHNSLGGLLLRNKFAETGVVEFEDVTLTYLSSHSQVPKADWRPMCLDLDGDGKLDIAGFTDDTSSSTLFNNYPMPFTRKTPFFSETTRPYAGYPGYFDRAGFEDYNGDGFKDIRDRGITRARYNANPRRYGNDWIFNPATRSFTKQNTSYVPPVFPQAINDLIVSKFADTSAVYMGLHLYDEFDMGGDSQTDIVLVMRASYHANRVTRLLIKQADGTYEDQTAARGLPIDGAAAILIRDLDNNGLIDIVETARTVNATAAGIYMQQPGGMFTKLIHAGINLNASNGILISNSSYLTNAEMLDADIDGWGDIAFQSAYSGYFKVYRNLGMVNGIWGGFEAIPSLNLVPTYGQPQTAGFMADSADRGDFNGDGNGSDIAFCRGSTSLTPKCEIYLAPAPPEPPPPPLPPPPPPTDPVVISTPDLPDAIVGDHYALPLSVSGGVPPYSCDLVDGSLPPGIEFTQECTIGGSATLVFPIKVVACDSTGSAACAARDLSITLVSPPPPLAQVPSPDETVQLTYERYVQETQYRRYLELSIRELQNELNRRDALNAGR